MKARFYLLSILLLVLDQGTKLLIQARLSLNESVPVIRGIFHITYVLNRGGVFGIGGRGGFPLIFVTASLVALLLVVLHLRRGVKEGRLSLPLSLVLAGAIGNLIDRLRLGAVIDFLDFQLKGWHWPAFNIADSAITVGIGLILWETLRERRE